MKVEENVLIYNIMSLYQYSYKYMCVCTCVYFSM